MSDMSLEDAEGLASLLKQTFATKGELVRTIDYTVKLVSGLGALLAVKGILTHEELMLALDMTKEEYEQAWRELGRPTGKKDSP